MKSAKTYVYPARPYQFAKLVQKDFTSTRTLIRQQPLKINTAIQLVKQPPILHKIAIILANHVTLNATNVLELLPRAKNVTVLFISSELLVSVVQVVELDYTQKPMIILAKFVTQNALHALLLLPTVRLVTFISTILQILVSDNVQQVNKKIKKIKNKKLKYKNAKVNLVTLILIFVNHVI